MDTDGRSQKQHLSEIIRDVQRLAGVHRLTSSRNGEDAPPLVIGVTSPRKGDGKTTVALAVANSLAQDFDRGATLVDADFETHSIAEQFGLKPAPGFVEVLTGDAAPATVIHDLPERTLRVVSAGLALDRSAQAVRLNSGTARIRELGGNTPFVVVDLPASFASTSTPILARLCDAVIVVARSGKTSQRELALTLDRLSDSNVVGVVLNRWSTRIPGFLERLLGLGR